MKFIVDECTGSLVGNWLRDLGYEVFGVYEEARGAIDEQLLEKAVAENWILITNDTDFADKIYRESSPYQGVIFLHLENQLPVKKIEILDRLLTIYPEFLPHCFTVVTETRVRFTKIQVN